MIRHDYARMSVWWRPDCLAGHVRFELRNVVANYPFERSERFPVIQPNSGRRDYSRLSCDGGSVARASCQNLGRMLALAGIAAFSADAEMIRRRPIQQYHCSLCAGLFPQGERLWVQFAPRSAPRCERGSSLESKHPCRLGGDRASRFRPPRADDHSVTSN